MCRRSHSSVSRRCSLPAASSTSSAAAGAPPAARTPATRPPTTDTWELDPDGDHTVLRFTNTVPGPADDATVAGWQLHLDALATILSGGQVDIAHPDPSFEPIHQAYTEKYGSPDD